MSVAGEAQSVAPRADGIGRRVGANLALWLGAVGSRRRLRSRRPRPFWRQARWLLAGVGLWLIAIALAMAFVDGPAIELQRLLPQAAVNVAFVVTELGKSGWLLLPGGLALLVIAALVAPAAPRLRDRVLLSVATRIGFVFMAIAFTGIVVNVLKWVLGRERPNIWVFTDPFSYVPFSIHSTFASLPSGHSSTAFATAVAIGALYPRLRVPLLVLATVVGASRVAVSTHFPSDVLAGALAGTLGALAVRSWFAARGLAFATTPDGTIRPIPGPSRRRLWHALRALRRP